MAAAGRGMLVRFEWAGASPGAWVTSALLVLNLADGVLTTLFLHLGVAREVNPLMRFAWSSSPLVFMALKLAVVTVGAWILWRYRASPAALFALRAGAALYLGIVVWHLMFLVRLLGA
jgi:hypothetical protein